MVTTYYLIGKKIIEEEQSGSHKSEYAKQILITLSQRLIVKYGRGYSVDNLENMRRFYLWWKTGEIYI
jgi:hypothetical protein